MPRSNIPYRSMRYFSNRKNTSFSRSHLRTSALPSDNQQGHVNNIIVFPKYSETTINIVRDDGKTLPFGNLHKKIKGRKRKDKQRLKKKQGLEVDVKPIIKKVKSVKGGRMKPRLNQHIIFLSDSDGENQEMHSLQNSSMEKENCEDDDDVIFVETPAAEIIEIEDSTEPNENSDNLEKSCERISSPDDFLDNAHVNLKSKFDVEPEVAEFRRTEFLKPSVAPIDMSESGSISSISDISASVGMNVFKLIDFPQEKVDLFDDDNLEKFRDAITPKRSNKKDAVNNEVGGNTSQNDNLPTLSDIQSENNDRKQRGRSIIKELVNDRAFVLLSTAQKKNKSKKRKSKDDSSETIQEDKGNDSSESIKKKKKKKTKKKEDTPEEDVVDNEKIKKKKEFEEDACKTQTVLSDSSMSEISSTSKKSKKNKQKDLEESVEENLEVRKKRSKKNMQEISDESDQAKAMLYNQDNHERKKKKNKKTTDASSENEAEQKKCEEGPEKTQENNDERKKKRNRRNIDVSINEERGMECSQAEDNEERKKKKIRRISEISAISAEEKESEFVEEKRKKRTKKISVGSDTVTSNIENIKEERDIEDLASNQHDEKDKEGNEDRKKRKGRKTSEGINPLISVELNESRVGDEIESSRENIQINLEDKTIKNCERIGSEGQVEEKLTQIIDDKESIPKDVEVVEIIETPEVKIDLERNIEDEEKINNDKKRAEEITKNNGKTLKLEECRTETLVVGEVEKSRKEALEELQNNEVERIHEEENDSEINIKRETNTDTVEITTDCSRKRKKETSISETVSSSNETKKMKMSEGKVPENVETPQLEVVEYAKNEEVMLEDVKEEVSVENSNNDVTLKHPDETENSPNDFGEKGGDVDNLCSKSEVPMVVVDNEGNVDMKLTGVFTTEKSIFGEVINFSNDVEISNFLDKSTSWNTHPSKFYSCKTSLFDNSNALQTSSVELTGDCSELQSDRNISTNTVVDLEVSKNGDEIINVKEEKEDETVEGNEVSSFREEVVVKVEIDEEKTDEAVPAIDQCEKELPDEIEEIVKEKENHHAVRKLCEFLEEVTDPNDVLKKVSMLKQAFVEKSQDTLGSVEVTYENDDVVSISSSGSSVFCVEDDVSVVSIEDDITLANCDIADSEVNKEKNVSQSSNSGEKTNDTLKNDDNDVISPNIPEPSDAIENVGATRKSNEKFEMVQSTPKRRIESVPSTSQYVLNFMIPSRETQTYQKGLDKYEVEDIQACMSDNPRLWRIVAEDIHPIKLPSKSKRCVKCREIGHLGYNCPNRLKLPKCSLCGFEGHLDFKCPNRLCVQCGRKTPIMQSCCEHCKHYKNLTCASCGNKGHPKNKCPDMWRRYHLTVNHGPLVQGDAMKLKDKKYLWCSSCAKSGHVESDCDSSWKRFKNFQPLDPRIHQYEDIYKVNPIINQEDFVQPNLDEVPHTSQNFLRNTDTSSSSSSSLDAEEKTETSMPSKETVAKDQTSQSVDEGLQGLTPEFEVVDEVNESNHEIQENVGTLDFFVTSTTEVIKQFLKQELQLLESSKFEIKNILPRFFTFLEDDKLPVHKQKFQDEKKKKFYKFLNMLLFGKLRVKCGGIHKDKLKHFVDSTPGALTKGARETLARSYDYIFRDSPRDNINYKFMLNMIKHKYGHQKWLY